MSPDRLVVEPLTPRIWPAFAELMEDGGPSRQCWCMYWRIGAEYRRRPAERNRADLHRIVASGPPPGLVAVAGSTAVGWCQLTGRDALPALDRAWRVRRVDDVPVWCVSCLTVRKGWRRQGVATLLVEAAVEAARRAGIPAVEACPLDADVSPSASGTGYASTFCRLGFTEVARRSPERPVMRRDLT